MHILRSFLKKYGAPQDWTLKPIQYCQASLFTGQVICRVKEPEQDPFFHAKKGK